MQKQYQYLARILLDFVYQTVAVLFLMFISLCYGVYAGAEHSPQLSQCKATVESVSADNYKLRQQIEDHAATHHDVLDGLMGGTGR